MKIIEVCHRIYPSYIGGIETAVWEISRHLAKKFEVEIYTTNPCRRSMFEANIDGIKIIEFPSFAPFDLFYFSPDLYKALKQVRGDIIHAHGCQQFPTLISALAKPKNRLPLIVTPHFGFSKVPRVLFTIYNLNFNRLVFERADFIIAVSPSEIFEIKKVGDFANKIIYIPNGIDFQKIDSYLSRFRQVDGPKIILYVGRLERKKGLQFLISAFSRITNLHDTLLIIVGDGPYKSEMLKMIEALKIKDKVKVLGRVSEEDLFRIYACSHIFVSLSSYESHSMSLTEAMGFGLVPIVTNVGGNPYVVSNHEDGFLVSYPTKVEEIVSILNELIQDQNLLKAMSEKARKKVKDNFDLRETLKLLEHVYEDYA